jgi:plastocyanin
MTMNASKKILILGALVAIGPVRALTACEGEPPVVSPENPLGAAPVAAPTTAPSAAEQGAAPPAVAACPPASCMMMMTAPPAGASAAPPAASAPPAEGSATAALPVPPTSVPRGDITGTISTKPASTIGGVVYLEDGPTEDQPSRLQTVTISNRQMNFVPFLSVVSVGGKAVFANEDPFPHNVFSPDNEKFNMGNLPQNGAHYRVFKNPGAYSLLCNLHPGMLGYLLVTPSPWYAKTDAKGNFLMKHVPTGTYKVTAWAPRQAPETQSVTVTESGATLHFDLHR